MKLSIEQFKSFNPCRKYLHYVENKEIDFGKIWDECDDPGFMFWLLIKTEQITKKQSVQIAVSCAERVLAIYENENPGDLRPRKAIEAAKDWISNPASNYAAFAASQAAYVSYFSSFNSQAFHVAYAAYAASAAASAAAFATFFSSSFDASASACAAADASANRNEEIKWQVDKIKEIVGPVEF
jgi:hypothetical protein